MRDPQLMYEHQTSEDLIGDQFDVDCSQTFSACLPDQPIEISLIVRHNDVQELTAFLESWETA